MSKILIWPITCLVQLLLFLSDSLIKVFLPAYKSSHESAEELRGARQLLAIFKSGNGHFYGCETILKTERSDSNTPCGNARCQQARGLAQRYGWNL